MIFCDQVGKTFPPARRLGARLRLGAPPVGRTVLHDISFSVARGEIFGLLGANGAGKTTLLKLMATLVAPSVGRIEIAGCDTVRDPDGVRRRMGLGLADDRSFYYRMSAYDNLSFFGTLAGLRGTVLRGRIRSTAERLGLENDLHRRYAEFSTGMRHRLGLTRAMLNDPDVLLLDEPTRAVDPLHTREIRRIVRREIAQRDGKTVVVATNSLDEAWEICDRVAILDCGRIAAMGTPRELRDRLRRPAHLRIAVDAADSQPVIDRLRRVRGLVDCDATLEAGGMLLDVKILDEGGTIDDVLRAVSADGVRVRHFESLRPQPADVFSELMSGGGVA